MCVCVRQFSHNPKTDFPKIWEKHTSHTWSKQVLTIMQDLHINILLLSTTFACLFTSCRFSCLHSPSRDHDQGHPRVSMVTLPTGRVQSDSPNWRLCGLLWTPPWPLMPTCSSGTALLPLQAHVTDYSSSRHRHVRHGLWLAQTRDNDTLWCQGNLAYISSTDQQWLLRAVQKKLCSIGQT